MENSYQRSFSSYKVNNILLFGLFKRTSVYYSKYDNNPVSNQFFLLYFHITLIYPTHCGKVICFFSPPSTLYVIFPLDTIIKHHRLKRFDISRSILLLLLFSFICLVFIIWCLWIIIKLYLKLYGCFWLYYTANQNVITSLLVTFSTFPVLPEITMFTCLPLFN